MNMEEGSLRCDANVSIRPAGDTTLGTKTELKNMNSFRFLERGIEAEIARQEQIVRDGGEVEQETLHYDPRRGAISSLRSKEEAHDYRYFPEPDLVPLAPTEEMIERARERAAGAAGGARGALRARPRAEPADTSKLLAFRGELGDYFEEALAADGGVEPATLANWVTVELVPRLGDGDPPSRRSSRRAGPARRARRPGRRSRSAAAQGGARCAGGRRRRPGGDRRGALARPSPAPTSSRASSSGRSRRTRRAVEELRGGKEGDWRDHRRGDARDEGARRRRRGPADDPGEAGPVGGRAYDRTGPAQEVAMSRLIRMDSTGHTTLAEWTTPDDAAFEAAVESSAASSTTATSACSRGSRQGHAGARAAARCRTRRHAPPDRRGLTAQWPPPRTPRARLSPLARPRER